MTTDYDIAIVGAGHNGLVAANYLARADKKVIVLETRDVVGGACVTEELIPGAKWSSCAFIAGLLRPQVIEELELRRFGLEMYQADVLSFSLFRDGSHMFIHREVDRTLREIERYSPRDAQRFVEFGMRLRRFADIASPWLLEPPPSRSEVLHTFERMGQVDLFNEFVLLSTRDLLDRYFESEHLKGLLTFFGMVSTWGGPSTPGTAYVYGHHSWGEFNGHFGQYGFVKGGMGSITAALAAGAHHYGATIRTSAPVAKVLVEGGSARGVLLETGEEVRAKVVISNADPKRSLLQLVDPEHLEADFRAAVEAIDQRGSMARIHLLIDELPAYLGFTAEEGIQHRGHQLLGASVDSFEEAWEAQRRGTFPERFVIEAVIQSATDSTLAPPGLHTLTLGVQQLPFALAEGDWDTQKELWTNRVIADLLEYAPNLDGHILERATITPLDLEREYNLTGGNIFHGQMYFDQLFSSRPLASISTYRTPIDGYYLCGAGMHPGGGVMAASGHNAAKVVLADLSDNRTDFTRSARRGATRKTLIDRVMATGAGRRASYTVARSRLFRPLVRLATRRPKS